MRQAGPEQETGTARDLTRALAGTHHLGRPESDATTDQELTCRQERDRSPSLKGISHEPIDCLL
ncbi:hypothetical protein GCM10018775_27170 [Streptomyces umbrinus]|nr:hypothetical protein GCM10018775_27170 [Streptomyces umbrinus]